VTAIAAPQFPQKAWPSLMRVPHRSHLIATGTGRGGCAWASLAPQLTQYAAPAMVQRPQAGHAIGEAEMASAVANGRWHKSQTVLPPEFAKPQLTQ